MDNLNITKEQLDAVVADAVKKALANRGATEKPKRVTDRIAKVRFFKDKLVRGYGNVDDKRDERGKLVAYMDVTLDGEDKPERVEYLQFLDKTPQYRVMIKRVNIDEIIESEGEFRTVNPDEAKIDRKKVKTSDIEVMEGPFQGQKFTVVDNDCLNH